MLSRYSYFILFPCPVSGVYHTIDLEYVEIVEALLRKHGATIAEATDDIFTITFPEGTVEKEHPAMLFSQRSAIVFPDLFELHVISTRRAVVLCIPR